MASRTPLLAAADYVLDLEPDEGGAIGRFNWRGEPVFRPRCGPGPFNSACFPLVPFSNRIAHGRFEANGRLIQLAPNFPGAHHPHALHGFGWLKPWSVAALSAASATLTLEYQADEWPWRFIAEQRFELSPMGLRHDLSVRNLGDTPMPAGLGFHPYFPASSDVTYRGLHRGEWSISADGLPTELQVTDQPCDWWDGRPVRKRAVDTVYVGRRGRLSITWPERELKLSIEPSAALNFTHVYSPARASYFCIEPVSHETDAVNREGRSSGLRWLEPNETFAVYVRYAAQKAVRADVGRQSTKVGRTV